MPRVPFDPAIDYYRVLGVEPDAPAEAIQAAYRKLAKAFHPDLNSGSAAAAERMARLNAAKSVLLDRQTREIYDSLRASRRARPLIHTPPPPPSRERVAAAASASAWASGPQTVDGFSVRYAPYQATARARYRVVSNAATRAERRRAFDRGTGILLLVAVPLIAALCLYLFQAFQLSIEPPKLASSDAILTPGRNFRPTTRGAADGVYQMVHTQPPSRELALRANNFILARSDSTPDSEELRADGRRLIRSATDGDMSGWNDTVADICSLAGRC